MAVKKKGVSLLPVLIIVAVIIFLLIKGFTTAYNKVVYKTDYSDIVTQYAEMYEIDPNFLFAVIKTESNFKPDAVSNVGARGLMQIMPDTYDWINSKLKLSDISYDDMFTPEHNIKFGSYLYGVLLREFDGYEAAVAAYHAGRGAVNKWLKDAKYSSDGYTLEKIPISDTQHYVNKVLQNYERYSKIYPALN